MTGRDETNRTPPGLPDPIDVRALMKEHNLWAKRRLGQSFLIDTRALDAIAEAAVAGGETAVIEIGAGLGPLTRALAATGRRVVAIERDTRLSPILRAIFAGVSTVTIVEADALAVDFAELAPETRRPAVAGNLPYSITTPLLLRLHAQRESLGAATLMVQREVADRLLARPRTKDYGSLSILFQLHAEMERVLELGPGAFWPAPKVHSTVLRLRWLDAPRVAIGDARAFERLVRAAFGQRRKTLRNALGAAYPKEAVAEAGREADIDLERRAETLSLEDFAQLAAALARSIGGPTSSEPPGEL